MFHCHLADHMHHGMMALFNVTGQQTEYALAGRTRDYFIGGSHAVVLSQLLPPGHQVQNIPAPRQRQSRLPSLVCLPSLQAWWPRSGTTCQPARTCAQALAGVCCCCSCVF
jgi:hypothetical protein